MLIFSISFPDLIKFSYFMDTPQRRVWSEGRPKDRVTLQIILVFILTHPKTFTWGHVSVFDKYLHWLNVSGKINKYIHCNKISLSVKKFECVSVNDLHTYMRFTCHIHGY
jgi:hypothetical protein